MQIHKHIAATAIMGLFAIGAQAADPFSDALLETEQLRTTYIGKQLPKQINGFATYSYAGEGEMLNDDLSYAYFEKRNIKKNIQIYGYIAVIGKKHKVIDIAALPSNFRSSNHELHPCSFKNDFSKNSIKGVTTRNNLEKALWGINVDTKTGNMKIIDSSEAKKLRCMSDY